MSISFDKAFGIHEKAMLLRAERAGVLANNLTNADTPGFKARDVDFHAVLNDQAFAAGTRPGLRVTHERHFRSADSSPLGGALQYRTPLQPAIDGNTVDTEIEQGAFMKNAVAYQASVQFLSRKVKGLIAVLRGE